MKESPSNNVVFGTNRQVKSKSVTGIRLIDRIAQEMYKHDELK